MPTWTRILTFIIFTGLTPPLFAGTVITDNLPANTAIVNIDATKDGAASYNGGTSGQAYWYHPFNTSSALLEYAVSAGTYSFRVINPADAAQLFSALTPAQTNQIYTAWTYNSPWIEDYLVFDSAAATNYSLPQIFDGAQGPGFANASQAYNDAVTNNYYNQLRLSADGGRDSTNVVTSYTFTSAATLIFVIPDYALGDNAGGVSVLVSPFVLNTSNLLVNPGAETGDLTGWTTNNNGLTPAQVDNGAFDSGINPRTGSYDFLGRANQTNNLYQVVSLVGNQGIAATAIDGGNLEAVVSFWEQGLNQGTPSDDAYISLAFWDSASNVISVVSTPEIDSHNLTWSNDTATFSIPANTRYIQYAMNFVRHAGSDNDSFVDDNSLTIFDSSAGTIPRLTIAPAAVGQTVISWTPATPGFVLQESSSLLPATWIDSASGATNPVTVPVSGGAKFYRLVRP